MTGGEWISLGDARVALGINAAELRHLIHAGALEGSGAGVTGESFEAYIASCLPGPTGEPPATCHITTDTRAHIMSSSPGHDGRERDDTSLERQAVRPVSSGAPSAQLPAQAGRNAGGDSYTRADPRAARAASVRGAQSPAPGPKRRIVICQYCRKRVYRARNGAWYHDHNNSVSCRPGEGSERRATPLEVTVAPRDPRGPADSQRGGRGGLPCAPAAPDGHLTAPHTERNPTQ